MTESITQSSDCGDVVCIGREKPSPHIKPMTNTELTLDQLQQVNGGAAFMKIGDIKGEYRQTVHPQYQKGEYRQVIHHDFQEGKNRQIIHPSY